MRLKAVQLNHIVLLLYIFGILLGMAPYQRKKHQSALIFTNSKSKIKNYAIGFCNTIIIYLYL